jgi:hypothetical protein
MSLAAPVLILANYTYFEIHSPLPSLKKQALAIGYPIFTIPNSQSGYVLDSNTVITNNVTGPMVEMEYNHHPDLSSGFKLDEWGLSNLLLHVHDQASYEHCGWGPNSKAGFDAGVNLSCTQIAQLKDGTPVYVQATLLSDPNHELYMTRQGTRLEFIPDKVSESDTIAMLNSITVVKSTGISFKGQDSWYRLDTPLINWVNSLFANL